MMINLTILAAMHLMVHSMNILDAYEKIRSLVKHYNGNTEDFRGFLAEIQEFEYCTGPKQSGAEDCTKFSSSRVKLRKAIFTSMYIYKLSAEIIDGTAVFYTWTFYGQGGDSQTNEQIFEKIILTFNREHNEWRIRSWAPDQPNYESPPLIFTYEAIDRTACLEAIHTYFRTWNNPELDKPEVWKYLDGYLANDLRLNNPDYEWLIKNGWVSGPLSNKKMVMMASVLFRKKFPKILVSRVETGIGTSGFIHWGWVRFELLDQQGNVKFARDAKIEMQKESQFDQPCIYDLHDVKFRATSIVVGKALEDPRIHSV